MNKIKFVLDIDDIHPQRGYGYVDEYHRRLTKLLDLGVRPTYFIVPLWNNNSVFDIRNYPEWIKSLGDGEFCIHGLTHNTDKLNGNDQKHLEFYNISPDDAVNKIVKASKIICDITGKVPRILRFPGWFASLEQAKKIRDDVKSVEYFADNFVSDQVLVRDEIKNIPYTCILGKDFNQINDLIICHAHISEGINGNNENALNDKNFKLLVKFIEENKERLEFVTLSEVFK